MKERSKRTLWIILCILCAFVYAQEADSAGHEISHGRRPVETHTKPEEILQWRGEGSPRGDQGALAVEEALLLLRPLQPNRNRNAHFDRTAGLVGSTIYYAKEVFYLMFMNGPSQDKYMKAQGGEPKLSKPLSKAVKLLEGAANEGEPDAIFLLAEMNFFGNYTHPRNYKEAFRRYQELASLNGNNSAQYMVGFMFATGVGGVVGRDQAKALLYHTFAAMSGNTKSQMTTAFRHHTAVGTPRNCNEAAFWYKEVADKAIAYSRTGPPGGVALQRDAYRIADENGGVYGEGASVVSSGFYANRAGPSSDSHAALDDVLEYLDLLSRKGDPKATFSLGRLHYEGSRTMKRNLRTARLYFTKVARKYWAKDGSILTEDNGIGRIAAKAAGYMGRMFLRGEGTEQSFEKAITWFNRGIKNGDSLCQYEMGIMYLHGLGVKKDAITAADYFKVAADQDFPSAQVNLGKLFLDQGDVQTATRFFELAARHNHIEAFYHLAEMSNNGVGRERSCGVATVYYKLVAEKVETIHSAFDEANHAFDEGDLETALVAYMMAAEQGYEYAQANVGYMLDEYKSVLSLDALIPWKSRRPSILRNAVLALIYWTRSAKQSNIDSMVKMGDYYLGGYGVDADMERAATCYQTAADSLQSAQALWNLGWIHENGLGVDQDFHLAKRFYDQALETNQESYFPVKLSLAKLRIRSFWNTITNGKVNSIQSEPDATRPPFSFREWLSTFLEDQHPYYHSSDSSQDDLPSSTEIPSDGLDDIDEGIIESLIIIALAGALAFLIYYRNQRQTHHRRGLEGQQQRQQQHQQQHQQQAQQEPQQGQVPDGQQADGGFFPPADDPGYAQWVAGGVGH